MEAEFIDPYVSLCFNILIYNYDVTLAYQFLKARDILRNVCKFRHLLFHS